MGQAEHRFGGEGRKKTGPNPVFLKKVHQLAPHRVAISAANLRKFSKRKFLNFNDNILSNSHIHDSLLLQKRQAPLTAAASRATLNRSFLEK